MEAPEKIYLIRNISTSTALNTCNDCHEKYLQEWYKAREKDADVEYTRTDAFIERAADWITRNGSYYIGFEQGQPCIDKDFIEDFKNYMKGE